MGGSLSCVATQVPSLQRLQYDMTHITDKSLPIIWFLGPPGSGRHTHTKLLAKNLALDNIKVAELIKNEAARDTDRGKIINEGINHRSKKVPDALVVDLIKEEMLRKAPESKGFIINNFPRNSKQAAIFTDEIDDVDVIVYLTSEESVMIDRNMEKNEGKVREESVRKAIADYTREIKESMSKFGNKIEKINTADSVTNVYVKVESAVNERITAKAKITDESDYAQSQSQEVDLLKSP